VSVPKNSLIDAASARPFLRCRSEALTKAFLLTPRDTDVPWSMRNPEAGRLATTNLNSGSKNENPLSYLPLWGEPKED
jgi:hypothetical protein